MRTVTFLVAILAGAAAFASYKVGDYTKYQKVWVSPAYVQTTETEVVSFEAGRGYLVRTREYPKSAFDNSTVTTETWSESPLIQASDFTCTEAESQLVVKAGSFRGCFFREGRYELFVSKEVPFEGIVRERGTTHGELIEIRRGQ